MSKDVHLDDLSDDDTRVPERATDDLLQELLWTYGPVGQEDAVRVVCARELQPFVDDMWTDDAGNLIGYIAASETAGDAASEGRDHRHRLTFGPSAEIGRAHV